MSLSKIITRILLALGIVFLILNGLLWTFRLEGVHKQAIILANHDELKSIQWDNGDHPSKMCVLKDCIYGDFRITTTMIGVLKDGKLT